MLRARYSCMVVVVAALVLSLVLSPNVAQAQAVPEQTVPNISVDPNVLLKGDQAVPDDVAETVKMRESLSREQLSSIQAIIDSHKSELQQINDELSGLGTPQMNAPIAQGNNVFIPFARGSGIAQQSQTEDAKVAQLALVRDNTAKIHEVTQKLAALQSQIDEEIASVLTETQREAYAKNAAKLERIAQRAGGRIDAMAANEVSPSSSSDCWYGAYYAALAWYYAYWGDYSGYYDYYYYGNIYAHAGYLAGAWAKTQIQSGLLNAGGAYFDAVYGFGYDSNDWSGKAYPDLYYGEDNAYYSQLYHWYSWQYYSSSYWGYWGYWYNYWAMYYADYANYYENYC